MKNSYFNTEDLIFYESYASVAYNKLDNMCIVYIHTLYIHTLYIHTLYILPIFNTFYNFLPIYFFKLNKLDLIYRFILQKETKFKNC